MIQFCAYTHSRPDGSVFYVGKGDERRARNLSRRNAHHKNIVKKHGEDNIKVTILPCSSEKAALSLERVMIKQYKSCGVNLCNRTDGGEGVSGMKHSAETRLFLSVCQSERQSQL